MNYTAIPVLPMVGSGEVGAPPAWALLQRHLLETMELAAQEFVDRYTHADGTLRWRTSWPGMDGSDDPYEAFQWFPLLYMLGGDENLLHLARRQYEAVTWQWTEYGQLFREFDANYDWMHHGESSTLFYLLGMADPTSLRSRQRAVRFANLYTGDDPLAQNYDPQHKLIRSPLTGSRGPRFTTTEEDWSTHREILDHYPPPFEDIPGVAGPTCPWTDDAIFDQILERINTRMARGDVPLNLASTSMAAHAYLHTGRERYRQWMLEYTAAWSERTARNGGITPDNVGLDDIIGQYQDGKWWGGYYGWRWPHGSFTILEPLAIAGCNTALLTGTTSHLALVRSQFDRLWELGKEQNGEWVVPHKHLDSGWTNYWPMNPYLPIYCWWFSQEEQDLQRVQRLVKRKQWGQIANYYPTGPNNMAAWFEYLHGRYPDYPLQILQDNYEQVLMRLHAMRADQEDITRVDIHHWQNKSPLMLEALVQLMLGAPLNMYHGGLLHTTVFYYDGIRRRPGVPPHVGALVEHLDAHTVTLQLVNMHSHDEQEIIVQAGAFGEHLFEEARSISASGSEGEAVPVAGKWLRVRLQAQASLRLRLTMHRFANRPCYETPWAAQQDAPALLNDL